MNDFNVAYRKMLADTVKCPKCGEMNTPHASETIDIDQTGTKGYCTNCSFARPIEAFLPKVGR